MGGIAEALQGTGLLVLDEAYVSFVDEAWNSPPLLSMKNVVLLRSMTKDYALTGLRLGYMLAAEAVVERVRGFQYSWSVNAPAQASGIAAFAERLAMQGGRVLYVATAEALDPWYGAPHRLPPAAAAPSSGCWLPAACNKRTRSPNRFADVFPACNKRCANAWWTEA